jgi:hypothetical protein
MNGTETRTAIQNALAGFATKPLAARRHRPVRNSRLQKPEKHRSQTAQLSNITRAVNPHHSSHVRLIH